MARLRRATLADLDTLVLHRRRMFEDMKVGSTRAQLDEADRHYRGWLRTRLKSGRLVAFVVEERGAVVASGCVWVKRIHPRPGYTRGDEPYLLSMYTAPEARGRGHASRIVRAAIQWVREEGYPRLTLHASEMGRPIYEKLGFERRWEMKLDLPTRRRRG